MRRETHNREAHPANGPNIERPSTLAPHMEYALSLSPSRRFTAFGIPKFPTLPANRICPIHWQSPYINKELRNHERDNTKQPTKRPI